MKRKVATILIFILWALIMLFSLFATGCKPQQIVSERVVEKEVRKEIRDTVSVVSPDTASIRMLLQCDSAGNVLIRELETERGRRITAEANLIRAGDNTSLIVDCKEDSLMQIIRKYKTEIEQLKSTERIVEKPIKYVPGYYKFCSWAFWVIFAIIAARTALWAIKKFYL